VPFSDFEDFGVQEVCVQVTDEVGIWAGVVVNVHAHFLDDEVWCGYCNLYTCREGDGPKRRMRSEGNVIHLGQSSNTVKFTDSTTVRYLLFDISSNDSWNNAALVNHVWLSNINRAFL